MTQICTGTGAKKKLVPRGKVIKEIKLGKSWKAGLMLIAKTYDLNGNMLPKKNTSIEKYQILYLSLFHIHISNVPLVHKKFHVHYQMLFQMFYLFLFHLYISKSPCALSNVLPLPVPRFQSEIGTGLLRQPPEMLGKKWINLLFDS